MNDSTENISTNCTDQGGNPLSVDIISAAKDEQDNIAELYTRIKEAIPRSYEWRLIIVDDGSTDRTIDVIKEICHQDKRVVLVSLSRNYGHQIALSAGYDIANADAVVSIDSDLQHPPETIPQMLQSWRENGNNIVFGVRKYDDKTGWFKRTSSRYFYRLLNKISDINLIEGAADFRLIDRNVLRYLKQYREKSRFIRGIIGNMGFRHDAVMYDEEPRTAGAVKYNLLVMMKFALAGILSFSSFPLRIVIATGMLISMLSIFYATWIITEKALINGKLNRLSLG